MSLKDMIVDHNAERNEDDYVRGNSRYTALFRICISLVWANEHAIPIPHDIGTRREAYDECYDKYAKVGYRRD